MEGDYDDIVSHAPCPIFSLSHRLLAFASSPPRNDPSINPSSTTQPHTQSRSLQTPSGPFGVSQVELGNAAVAVGGTVLSGIKSLGRICISIFSWAVIAAIDPRMPMQADEEVFATRHRHPEFDFYAFSRDRNRGLQF